MLPLVLALSGVAAMALNGLLPAVLQPGAVIPATLEDARAQIVQLIRKLEESGQIVIRREGEDEYVS